MDKFLIINADDFGLHNNIDLATEKAILAGTVKSISFITNTIRLEESIKIIKKYPYVSVGIHLNITDGKPITGGKGMEFLLNAGGDFLTNHRKAVQAVFFNQQHLSRVEMEFMGQISKLKDSGIRISHLDSHGYVHLLPCLLKLAVKCAKKFSIPFIRTAKETAVSSVDIRKIKVYILNIFSKYAKVYLKKERIKYPDSFFGAGCSGRMNRKALGDFLQKINPGLTELTFHPGCSNNVLDKDLGWQYNWQEELNILTGDWLVQEIAKNKIKLTNFEHG